MPMGITAWFVKVSLNSDEARWIIKIISKGVAYTLYKLPTPSNADWAMYSMGSLKK